MAYQSNKPLPTDRLKDSQSDIQANFLSLYNAWIVNHVTFDDANAGKHAYIQFPEQVSNPTTSSNEIALFSKENGGVAQLFLRRESNGTVVNITNDLSATTNGWTRLINGLILKWETFTVPRNTLSTVTFAVNPAIPAFTTLFSVTASQSFGPGPTLSDLNTAISVGNFTATSFQVYPRAIGLPSSGDINVCYQAIGI